jgi:GNAT superfamily N-acetyltransferase/RimJ/RimL family protein N-acetyltransferase
MHIEGIDLATDTVKVRACYDIYAASAPVDDPHGPVMSWPVFSGWLRLGWHGNLREGWLATADDDVDGPSWAGFYLLEMSGQDNPHRAYLTLVVSPDRRRSGTGTRLLRHAAARAAATGRTLLVGETPRDSAGAEFAVAMGAQAGITEIRRWLDVTGIPAGHLAGLRRRAEEAAAGYSLVRWEGPTPEEYVEQVVAILWAMADAPHDPDEEPHHQGPERLRRSERRVAEQGVRRYSVAARCDRTGELAGLTQIGVDPEDRGWGHQFTTVVAREHRGHRLGLLIKVVMLENLAAAEPGVNRFITGNADSNRYMIAINEEIGFRVLDEWPSWRLDVAAVPGVATVAPGAVVPGTVAASA